MLRRSSYLRDAPTRLDLSYDGIETPSAVGVRIAIAEFERERTRERVLAGLQGAKAQDVKLGTPSVPAVAVDGDALMESLCDGSFDGPSARWLLTRSHSTHGVSRRCASVESRATS